jgi:hypothetical protein
MACDEQKTGCRGTQHAKERVQAVAAWRQEQAAKNRENFTKNHAPREQEQQAPDHSCEQCSEDTDDGQ